MSKQTDAVIAAITQRIDAGDLLPGDAVDEKELMDRCTVSRTPVREALIRLETSGLIARHPRKGATIYQPDVAAFLAILEVHANLESFAAGLAAQRITPEIEAELTANVAACAAHAQTHGHAQPAEYYALNRDFHEIIVRAAGNEVLSQTLKTNARKLMAYYRLRYRQHGAALASAAEHNEIAQRIISGDAQGAAAAMLAHFNYDRETVMDLIASVG